MHPASKQRSEGEKVRVGDDLILVSVSSERYLVSSPTRHSFRCHSVGGAQDPPPPHPPFADSLGPMSRLPSPSFLTSDIHFGSLVPHVPIGSWLPDP